MREQETHFGSTANLYWEQMKEPCLPTRYTVVCQKKKAGFSRCRGGGAAAQHELSPDPWWGPPMSSNWWVGSPSHIKGLNFPSLHPTCSLSPPVFRMVSRFESLDMQAVKLNTVQCRVNFPCSFLKWMKGNRTAAVSVKGLTPVAFSWHLFQAFPGNWKNHPCWDMHSRLLADSPGEWPVQEECISTPGPDPRGGRHRDVPDSCLIWRRQNTGWSSWHQYLLPPRFWLPHGLPGESPASSWPSWESPNFARAFQGSPQHPQGLPGEPTTMEACWAIWSQVTDKVLPTLAPQALSHWLDPRPWAL